MSVVTLRANFACKICLNKKINEKEEDKRKHHVQVQIIACTCSNFWFKNVSLAMITLEIG